MAKYVHLDKYELREHKEALHLISGMENWLRGNVQDSGNTPPNAVLEVWSEQMDEATFELRRLVHDGPGRYAIIRTKEEWAKSPVNLLNALYVTLIIDTFEDAPKSDEIGRVVIANVVMRHWESVWVAEPVLLGPRVTFLVLIMSHDYLGGREGDYYKHALAWYKGVLADKSTNKMYICPLCKTAWRSTTALYMHFREVGQGDPNRQRQGDPMHHDFSLYSQIADQDDWNIVVKAFRDFLGWKIDESDILPRGECFELNWLVENSFGPPQKRDLSRPSPSTSIPMSMIPDQRVRTRPAEHDVYGGLGSGESRCPDAEEDC